MDSLDKIVSLAHRPPDLTYEDEAKQAAAEYIRQANPIDKSMGWRLDDVVAAFLAGAAWRAVR